jgi:prophage tail gpP-like protein
LNEFNGAANNVTAASARYDYTKLFHSYAGLSAFNTNGFVIAYPTPGEAVNAPIPDAVNKNVRKSRKYIFIPESIATNEDVTQRVQWKRDTDKANALMYTCSIVGFTAEQDNILWKPNLLVNVVDDFAGVRGQFLITNVEYHFAAGITNGATCDLTMVSQEAYRLESEQNSRETEENVMGLGFVINDAQA